MKNLFSPIMRNLFRNLTSEADEQFLMSGIAGQSLYDAVTATPAITSISGARYGIVNGVVAQFAANLPRIEDEGFGACPAFTQLAKYTEDLTDASWEKDDTSITGLAGTFQGQNIWNCVESTTPSAYHTFQQNPFAGIADNSVIGFVFIAKHSGRKLFVTLRTKANSYISSRFDLQTGVIETTGSGHYVSMVSLGDGYYRIFCAASVGTGATKPQLYIQLCNSSNNALYTGDGVSGVLLGQPTYINFGVGGIPFIPPYVPNNTDSSVSVVSEAATSTTGTSFDLDLPALSRLKTGLRGPNAQGHIELEFELNINRSWITSNIPIISVANDPTGDLFYYSVSGNAWAIYDTSANKATVAMSSFYTGDIIKIKIDYGTYTSGTQKMRLTVNGVKSSVVAFSGSFGAQDLRFFFGNTVHIGWIKKDSLKYSDKPIW